MSSSEVPLFEFCPATAQSRGRPLADGRFVVMAGSTAIMNGTPKVKRDEHDRDRLVRDGILVSAGDGVHFRFARDCVFSSASKAAGVIKDGNASGPGLWIETDRGRSLKEYLEELQP